MLEEIAEKRFGNAFCAYFFARAYFIFAIFVRSTQWLVVWVVGYWDHHTFTHVNFAAAFVLFSSYLETFFAFLGFRAILWFTFIHRAAANWVLRNHMFFTRFAFDLWRNWAFFGIAPLARAAIDNFYWTNFFTIVALGFEPLMLTLVAIRLTASAHILKTCQCSSWRTFSLRELGAGFRPRFFGASALVLLDRFITRGWQSLLMLRAFRSALRFPPHAFFVKFPHTLFTCIVACFIA